VGFGVRSLELEVWGFEVSDGGANCGAASDGSRRRQKLQYCVLKLKSQKSISRSRRALNVCRLFVHMRSVKANRRSSRARFEPQGWWTRPTTGRPGAQPATGGEGLLLSAQRSTGVPRSYETAPPSDSTVGLSLGPNRGRSQRREQARGSFWIDVCKTTFKNFV